MLRGRGTGGIASNGGLPGCEVYPAEARRAQPAPLSASCAGRLPGGGVPPRRADPLEAIGAQLDSVSGQFDAVNVIPANSLTDAYFGFMNPSASGTVFVDAVNGTLDLDGITLGTLDPDGPGGADPLVLKGDFFFSGEVPEPGVALLLGAAASALVVSAQRRGRRV